MTINNISGITYHLQNLNKKDRSTLKDITQVVEVRGGKWVCVLVKSGIIGRETKIHYLRENLRCIFILLHYKQKDKDQIK